MIRIAWEKAVMAAERFFRGPVDREDGLAKTSLSDNFSVRVHENVNNVM